ncbi:hypothetical protein BOTCAL_0351g00060 [Botryotinia calthae]|uniref:Uncharacterized protein n=1 Tax=Botryotinia calthae TaxID=38488 RepID=A0A4Y8CSG5_9HELO|nr:hypothetical protein BOTCAL_0351g00060 [Botryotinia calthae]
MNEYIQNEQKELKGGDLARRKMDTEDTGGIRAYNAAFEHDKNCSPEVWETRRMMLKVEDLYQLISDQYGKILKSKRCSESPYRTRVLEDAILELKEHKKAHEFAKLALVPKNSAL